MKKTWKRFAGLVLAMLMMASVIPVQASAASISVLSSVTITKYSSKDYGMNGTAKLNKQYFTYVPGKITKLKSSDTKIVTVSKTSTGSGYHIYLTAKKKGTATVSFKYGSKTYKTKVTVSKYKNPISSFKIGSTTLKGSKFASRATYTLKYSKFKNKKVKVTIKMANGWTLGNTYNANSYEYGKRGDSKTSVKKNGEKVTVKGGSGFFILMEATNKSSGQTEQIIVRFK